jgi:hypothetical protein
MYLTVVSESKWNLVGGEQGLQVIQALKNWDYYIVWI